jgi:hypothetical protein
VETNVCSFYTLPFVDGYLWSTPKDIAGLRFKTVENGKEVLLTGGDPKVTNTVAGKLHIAWPLKSGNGTLIMDLDEKKVVIKVRGKASNNWFLDLNVAGKADLPFKEIAGSAISCQFKGLDYRISTPNGSFSKPNDSDIFRVKPKTNALTLNFADSD